MACFGTRLKTIKDCGLLIEELIVLRDNRPARTHALWREKQKHPRVPVTDSISWLDPGHSGWLSQPQMSFPLSSEDTGSSVWWYLAASHQGALCCAMYPLIGGGFSATPWLSSFSVQLTGELGSKDSRKGKNCVQMALLKPLGRHYGGDQHYISHKSKPARDQGWLLRGPEPGTTMTESLTQNSSWPILH